MSVTMDPTITSLPYIDIQHDALSVFDDVEQGVVTAEDIWISGYKAGSSSVHGKAKVVPREGGGGGSDLRPRDGVHIERVSKTSFRVSIPSLGLKDVPVRFPRGTVRPPYTKANDFAPPLTINSIAISPKSPHHLLIGGPDGYCGVEPVGLGSSTDAFVKFKGHVGDVLDVKWFPSGEVCLTASSDLSIRVWGSKDGINPRTLVGHSRAVTSLHILGVGKEVLSGSKDGTVRLWEVGPAKQLKRWNMERIRPVESIIVVEDQAGLEALGLSVSTSTSMEARPHSEAEGSSKRGVVMALTQMGMEVWDSSGPSSPQGKPIKSLEWGLGSNLVCGAYSPELGLIATGHTNGVIALRRLRDLDSVRCFRRNESPVYSLRFGRTATPTATSADDLSREGGRDRDKGKGRRTASLYSGTAAGLPCRLEVTLEVEGEEQMNQSPNQETEGEGADGSTGVMKVEVEVKVMEEYAGWDATGVESWSLGSDGSVWCAGAESEIRRY